MGKGLTITLFGVALVATSCVSYGVGAAGGTSTTTATGAAPTVTVTATGKAPRARPTVTETETVTAAPEAPKGAIEEGVWVVGEDITPGNYKTAQAVSEGCYWKITRSGSNGENIIQNDLPTGGMPRVTLSKGQDFTTQDCGDWIKTK